MSEQHLLQQQTEVHDSDKTLVNIKGKDGTLWGLKGKTPRTNERACRRVE